nr:hypothetical protein [Kibdelosporangium sp. MJ126-NF4]
MGGSSVRGIPAATPGTAPRKPDSGLRPGQTLIDQTCETVRLRTNITA